MYEKSQQKKIHFEKNLNYIKRTPKNVGALKGSNKFNKIKLKN